MTNIELIAEIERLQNKVNALETENAALKESVNGNYDAEKFIPGNERDINLVLRDGKVNRGWYTNYDHRFKMYDENSRSGFSNVYDDNPIIAWRELK
jgi:hypothetical protein